MDYGARKSYLPEPPHYNSTMSSVLGGMMFLIGGGAIIVEGFLWSSGQRYAGLWCGVVFAIFGFFALVGGQTNNAIIIAIELAMAIISVCCGLAMFVVVTVTYYSKPGVFIALAWAGIVISVWALVTLCKAIYLTRKGGVAVQPSAPAPVPTTATLPVRGVLLQQAAQTGTYQSYVQDGVPYTAITFPNTLITPTMANTGPPPMPLAGFGQGLEATSGAGPTLSETVTRPGRRARKPGNLSPIDRPSSPAAGEDGLD